LIRTQILLEEEQHKFLLEEARKKGVSLSELFRRLITEKQHEISLVQSKGGLEMAKTAVPGPSGHTHHDEVLYK